jgi:hypothetical protein
MKTINDIVLTVINDGDGKQCGLSYQDRLAVMKQKRRKAPDTETALVWYKEHINNALRTFEGACRKYSPQADSGDIKIAAKRIYFYYCRQEL